MSFLLTSWTSHTCRSAKNPGLGRAVLTTFRLGRQTQRRRLHLLHCRLLTDTPIWSVLPSHNGCKSIPPVPLPRFVDACFHPLTQLIVSPALVEIQIVFDWAPRKIIQHDYPEAIFFLYVLKVSFHLAFAPFQTFDSGRVLDNGRAVDHLNWVPQTRCRGLHLRHCHFLVAPTWSFSCVIQ